MLLTSKCNDEEGVGAQIHCRFAVIAELMFLIDVILQRIKIGGRISMNCFLVEHIEKACYITSNVLLPVYANK